MTGLIKMSVAFKFEIISVIILLILITIYIIGLKLRRSKYKKRFKRKSIIDSNTDYSLSANECICHFQNLAEYHQIKNQKHTYVLSDINKLTYKKLKVIRCNLGYVSSDIISFIPSARWLFDNFYLMSREIKKNQSSAIIKKNLPMITDGEFNGYPRIYAIAHEMVTVSGDNLNEEKIIEMLNAYQRVQPLTSAELWAFISILGLCILENIVVVADDILHVISVKSAAETFVQKIFSQLDDGYDIPLDFINEEKYIDDNVFLSHVLFRLKTMSVDESQINKFMSSIKGTDATVYKQTDTFQEEGKYEMKLETITRSLITSLRVIETINIEDMFESVSPIENILSQDPANIYKKMDFRTRNQYCFAVEDLSYKFKIAQWDVADKVIEISKKNKNNKGIKCANHVGSYLIGKDKCILKDYIKNKHKIKNRQCNKNKKGIIYTFSFTLISIILILFMSIAIDHMGYELTNIWSILFLALLVPPAIGIAQELTNYIFTNIIITEQLPSMDFSKEIPDEYRTFVVMPVILQNSHKAEIYAARLEKYYLANMQSNLYFALLGDLPDAESRTIPIDDEIINTISKAFSILNKKYPSEHTRFSFFMRYRKWNPAENCWMGWERKRGKLEEFNALLCGEKDTTFSLIQGDEDILSTFKYVITLDADTDLIRNCASKFVGVMAHPLNMPKVNLKTMRVESGYAIIQSEIRNHMVSFGSSVFSKIFTQQQGLDPYTRVIADVYQDTFGKGTFIGKGIYDLQVMHNILYRTLPENTVLSHDLLESSYVRCAFSSKVTLMDNYPSNIESYMKREHRWIRGDWQLIPWLFTKSTIDTVSKWKIIDNLRRSLVSPSFLAAILISVFVIPKAYLVWIPIVFFTNAFHFCVTIINTIIQKALSPKSGIAILNFIYKLLNNALQAFFMFILIPYRGYTALDAIGRTLYRLIFSRKKLLQWQTAESIETSAKNSLATYLSSMWIVIFPVVAIIAGIFHFTLPNSSIIIYYIVAFIWLFSPLFAFLLSLPRISSESSKLKSMDKDFLRILARRTSQFFKDFATEDRHWLCPDNYQITPIEKVSEKTSPTNIGLQLLSLLSARDFGYQALISFINDCKNITNTLNTLEKWHGHLYNWYDIKTLEILPPCYVSTVDSGNYLGYLITFKNGLIDLKEKAVFSQNTILGLKDTIAISGFDCIIPEDFATVNDFVDFLDNILEKLRDESLKQWEDEKWIDLLKKTCVDFINDARKFDMLDLTFDDHTTLIELAETGNTKAQDTISNIDTMVNTIEQMIMATDFTALYNKKRALFYIGYHTSSQKHDSGYYDLMASESSLTSFLAIAKNDVPQKHWFKLGRPLITIRGIPTFVSWSGTMFEYLMPYLIMKDCPRSVFNQSAKAAVIQQQVYANKMNIPWGISESQYFTFDINSNYQYKAFGIPRLQLKTTRSKTLVVAPYATVLALCISLKKAVKNLHLLFELHAYGEYGFYEALDFSSPDVEKMQEYSVVKSFMAHHQGMIVVSLNNLLNQNIMRRRFHEETMVKATEVLLEETREQDVISVMSNSFIIQNKQMEFVHDDIESRYVSQTSPPLESAHWLSNGHYSLMLTSDGDGFSKWNDVMINHWRPDVSTSAGSYIYLREKASNKFWSAAFKPTKVEPDFYKVIFSHNQVEYIRSDGDISTHTSITLSPTEDFEVRKVSITNNSDEKKQVEVTSYIEVVLDKFLSELYHPAFNKLFLESEYVADHNMIIYKRRKNVKGTHLPLVYHMLKTDRKSLINCEYETNRQLFVGRNNTPQHPDAIYDNSMLSSKDDFSFDPIFSLRANVVIPPGRTVNVTYITGACDTKEEAFKISDHMSDNFGINNVFDQFRLNSELEIKYLNINSKKVNAFQELIGPLFYPNSLYRGQKEYISRNWKNQSFLWQFGVSGDNPIMLLCVESVEEISIIRDVLKAYEYYQINEIMVDLIILIIGEEGYMQELGSRIAEMTSLLKVYDEGRIKPSLFVLHTSRMQKDEIDLLYTVARIVFNKNTGLYFRNLQGQIDEIKKNNKPIPKDMFLPKSPIPLSRLNSTSADTPLEFYNDFGGFSDDGKEYVILLDEEHKTPAPWINVIANNNFGFHISESGAGYTWSVNSHENKLTSWSNDPVCDTASEAIYIRDNNTDEICSPTRLGYTSKGSYKTRHGFGYSVFEHEQFGIKQEMTVFVPLEEPVKIFEISLHNTSNVQKSLNVTLFVEWVLGLDRTLTAPYIVTDYENDDEYLSAKGIYNYSFRHHHAFIFSSEKVDGFTSDRKEFFGANGSSLHPAGLLQDLSNTVGAALDPCGVIRVNVVVDPDETKKITFGLGQCDNTEAIKNICTKYRDILNAERALVDVTNYWHEKMNHFVVKTNDRAIDIMANGWLIYQTISCRIKARAAFYQCGGAYGFRDQLQDMLALLDIAPDMVRNQIITSCSRQFVQGDVQHWWHPPTGLGVRTRISDDLLWLPYVTSCYINHTSDYSILDEMVPFINGNELSDDQHEIMFTPTPTVEKASVYEHCLRAIDRTSYGKHGLPLMGGGDWNDGMNLVGIDGIGESVWLGWFVCCTIDNFIPVCEYKQDTTVTNKYNEILTNLKKDIEQNAWDGEWYMRAFYDNGQKLGSKENKECRIDSISQSWSVISGAGSMVRTHQSLYSAKRYLVDEKESISLLLAPPFDKTENNPGYIKDYYPGIRENGGQYTHAAIWLAIANAIIKDCETTGELLNMLNPVHICETKNSVNKYEKEPYVVVADISMGETFSGRGGWSWYTGSAGWLYQAITRWFLGIRRQGNTLIIDPATPASFGDYQVEYKYNNTLYRISVERGDMIDFSITSIILDGKIIKGKIINLVDDDKTHEVIVRATK